MAAPTRRSAPARLAAAGLLALALASCAGAPAGPDAPGVPDAPAAAPASEPAEGPAPTPVGLATPGPDELVALTEGSAADEYRATIAEIGQPLPAGRAFPPGLPADFVPTAGHLEQGAARNQAWFTWLCAWEAEYLDAHAAPDPVRVAAAAAQLEWYATAPFYIQVVQDPEGGWVTNVLGPLREGDPSGVAADTAQMCFQFSTVPDAGA